jgi:uncharacterized membrane protein YhaH (DUF805 family)
MPRNREISNEEGKQYLAASMVMLLGVLITVVGYVVFQSNIATVCGIVIILFGVSINPQRLTTLVKRVRDRRSE